MSATERAPVVLVGCPKGGIGRTVIATNLAAMLALAGRRTLLVDLDAKGDATESFGLKRATAGRNLARLCEPWSLLEDTQPVARPAGLDVWAGGPVLEQLGGELSALTGGGCDALDRGLQLARQRYRAIVIDAPPDLGPLARTGLAAADVLLMPIAGAAFAERALEETIDAACRVRQDMRVFAVRVVRDGEPVELEDEEAGPLGVELLDCALTIDGAVLEAATRRGLPVFEHAPASRLARCFLELGREVIDKIVEPGELIG